MTATEYAVGAWQRTLRWWRAEPSLYRWKLGVTAIFILLPLVGLYHQTAAQAAAAAHNLDCTRARNRDDVRAVLFQIVDVRSLFADDAIADLYRTSRVAIIEAALPHLDIPDCPAPI